MTSDSGPILFVHDGRAFGAGEVLRALRRSGIAEGDSIFVHSDLKSFGKLPASVDRQAYLDAYLSVLREAVGRSGNLLMPTFSYSFTKNEPFDPETTPSTVGILTEHFRQYPGVERSGDPLFSAAALGPDQRDFVQVGDDCFGAGSIFEKLHQKKAKLVFLGNTFDITFMHYVEQRVGAAYRHIKRFEGQAKIGGEWKTVVCKYNVRPLDDTVNYDLEKIAAHLDSQGVLRTVPLGSSHIRWVSAADAYDRLAEGLKNDPHLLLRRAPFPPSGVSGALPA